MRQRTKALSVANAELKSEIERRKGLEGEILSVSDREQQRLGQELHDGLCQHLTAVAFMTRSIALRLKNHRVIDAADIEKVAELVNTAAVDTRNLSRALAPGGCRRSRRSSSLCKISLTGKFGERPAGWKSNRHFKSTMTRPRHISIELRGKQSLTPINTLRRGKSW